MAGRLTGLIALTACRWNFESIAVDDSADSNSPDDAPAFLAEPCNGIDDDDDGDIDEQCPCSEVDISMGQGAAVGRTGIAYTGTDYLVLAVEGASYAVRRASAPTTPLVFAPRTSTAVPVGEGFAWSGTTLAIAYAAGGVATIAIADVEAGMVTPVSLSAAGAANVRVVWARDRFAAAWREGGRVHLQELAADGALLGTQVVIDTPVTLFDAFAAIPDGYAFAAYDASPAIILATRPGFTPLVVPVNIGMGQYMTLAATTSAVVVAWGAPPAGTPQLQSIALDGTARPPVAVPVGATEAFRQAAMVRDRDGFRVVVTTGAPLHTITSVALDTDGQPRGPNEMISTFSASTWYPPGVVATSGHIAVAKTYQQDAIEMVDLASRCL